MNIGHKDLLHYGRLASRLESVSQTALATVLTIVVEGHEDTCTALRGRTLTTKTFDFSVRVHLVVFQDGHLNLLAFVLDLFGSVVGLLLTLLGTTTKAEDQVKSRLLLDVVVAESASIFELLAGEDQALLVGGDTFLVLDLGLDIVDGVGGFYL